MNIFKVQDRSISKFITFGLVEVLIIAFYFYFLYIDQSFWAYSTLGALISFIVFILLFSSPKKILNFFLIMLPFTLIGLFPKLYRELFIYTLPIFSLLFLGITNHIHKHEFKISVKPIGINFKLLILALVVSFFNAYYHGWFSLQLLRHTYIFIQSIVLLLIIINLFQEKNELLKSIYILFIACSVACFVFILVALIQGGDVIVTRRVIMPFAGYGLNAHAIFLGPYVVLGTSLLWLSNSIFKKKAILIFCILSIIVVLLITQSRGSWFAVLIGILYFFSIKRYYRGIIIIALLIVIVSGFQVFRGILSARLTQISTGDLSLLARISLWRVAVRVIEHNFLFGVGANNFLNIKYQYGIPHWLDPTKAFNTHNLYLEILVNFGIIGFIGFFSLIAKTFKKLSDIIKTKEDNDISTLSLGLKAAILTFLIHGLIDCGLYLNMIFYSFMIIIGFSWAIIILSEKKSPNNKTGINLCRKNT